MKIQKYKKEYFNVKTRLGTDVPKRNTKKTCSQTLDLAPFEKHAAGDALSSHHRNAPTGKGGLECETMPELQVLFSRRGRPKTVM
jgi:hypothetical protein